jgi:dUTP pyrophosphatase
MEEKANPIQINILDEIFGALDGALGNDETDGLKILGAVLAMPNEAFETVKGTICNTIEESFNDPAAHVAFAQMMNEQGLYVEDFIDNLDDIVRAVDEMVVPEGMELSESKKDFIKFIFTTFINSMESSKSVPRRIISIPVKLCREGAKLPTYATDGSAAMDIYSPEEYTIAAGESVTIPVGLKVNIPKGYAIIIQPRSGMSRKTKIRIPNSPGLIDSDYHEEIGVIVENVAAPLQDLDPSPEAAEYDYGKLYGPAFTIGAGERFAQMRLIEVPLINWLPVESIGTFDNDHGTGFGGTGTK